MNQQTTLEKKQYHFVYQITNTINGKIYIGKHSTFDLNDGYFASGKHINNALTKYGRDNFKWEILEYYDTSEDAYLRESQLVNIEFVEREDTYNAVVGGHGWTPEGRRNTVVCYDPSEDRYRTVSKETFENNDQLVTHSKGRVNCIDSISGKIIQTTKEEFLLREELIAISKGKKTVTNGSEFLFLPIDDERILNGEFWHVSTGTVVVRDIDGNTSVVKTVDERFLSGELKSITSGKVVVTDGNQKFQVSVDDERYLSGELIPIGVGKVVAKDKHGVGVKITVDEFKNNKDKYSHHLDGMVTARNSEGDLVHVTKEEFHSREDLVGNLSGKLIVYDKISGRNTTILKDEFDSSIHKTINSDRIRAFDSNGNLKRILPNDERLETGELRKDIIKVYNNKGEVQFEFENKNIEQTLRENNLPRSILKTTKMDFLYKSALNNPGTIQQLKNRELDHLIGWFIERTERRME